MTIQPASAAAMKVTSSSGSSNSWFSMLLGASCAASATNYLLKNLFDFSDLISVFLILLPFGIVLFGSIIPGIRFRFPRSNALDAAVAVFCILRFVQFLYPNGPPGVIPAVNSMINLGGYYVLGRMIAFNTSAERFSHAFGIVATAACIASAPYLTQSGYERLSLGEAQPVGIAQSYLIAGVYLIALMFSARRLVHRALSVPAMIWVFYLAAANGTRSIFIGLVVAASAVLFGVARRAGAIASSLLIAVPAVLFAGLNFVFSSYVIDLSDRYSILFGRFLVSIGVLDLEGIVDASVDARKAIWTTSIRSITENPVTGSGAGVISSSFEGMSPHNLFLEAAADGGVFAAGLLLAFFVAVCLICFRLAKTPGIQAALVAAGALALLFEYNVSFFLDSARNLMMLSGMAVSLNQLIRGHRSATSQTSILRFRQTSMRRLRAV